MSPLSRAVRRLRWRIRSTPGLSANRKLSGFDGGISPVKSASVYRKFPIRTNNGQIGQVTISCPDCLLTAEIEAEVLEDRIFDTAKAICVNSKKPH